MNSRLPVIAIPWDPGIDQKLLYKLCKTGIPCYSLVVGDRKVLSQAEGGH